MFRCTYCNNVLPKPPTPGELGMNEGERPVADHLYSYSGCYCGQGRFIIAELTSSSSSASASPATPSDEQTPRGRVERAEYRKLLVSQVHPNPNQPRKFFDQEALQSLADSIKTVGLLEDVLVRPDRDGYELVLGERRWRATQLAGLDTISAKVVPLSDEDVRRISIVENVQRENLSDVEEAFAYKQFIDSGMRQADVGVTMGKMGDRVAERLKVLSSHYYVEYQQERIRQLTVETERLRDRLDRSQQRYDTRVVDRAGLVDFLGAGYDLVTSLDGGEFVVRRQVD